MRRAPNILVLSFAVGLRLAEPATSLFNLAENYFSLDFPDRKCDLDTR